MSGHRPRSGHAPPSMQLWGVVCEKYLWASCAFAFPSARPCSLALAPPPSLPLPNSSALALPPFSPPLTPPLSLALTQASQILLILQHLFQAQEIIAMLPSTSAERRTHPPTAAASSLHHPQPTTRDSRILTFAGHVPALADVARALKEVMSACVAEASVPRGRTLLAQVQCFLYFSQCIVIFRPVHGACSNVFMYSSEISNPPKYFSLLALSDSNCDFEMAVCAILKWPYVTVVASCF